MSSNGFAHCRVFELGRSPRLAVAVTVLHAAGAIALLAAQLPWATKVVALATALASARHALRTHTSRTARSAVVRLVRRDDGYWCAERRDGTSFVGTLARDSYIHRHLVVVGIKDGWRTLFTPVPADALNTNDHRRLRVWVKWQPPAKPPDATAVPPVATNRGTPPLAAQRRRSYSNRPAERTDNAQGATETGVGKPLSQRRRAE
ncbi:MAG: protein YgfX [Gammaproteobacteria bacterium]